MRALICMQILLLLCGSSWSFFYPGVHQQNINDLFYGKRIINAICVESILVFCQFKSRSLLILFADIGRIFSLIFEFVW